MFLQILRDRWGAMRFLPHTPSVQKQDFQPQPKKDQE